MFGRKKLTGNDYLELSDEVFNLVKEKVLQLDAGEAIKFLMHLDTKLYDLQGKTSVRYGDGKHSKHKHIKYHDFFKNNIKSGENVLDIGSSFGFLTASIAEAAAPGKVIGIEIIAAKTKKAKKNYQMGNLEFVTGDATVYTPDHKVDVITMSNVLEHIEDRVGILSKLKNHYKPDRFLIRVPMFQRDWRVPLKKELGLDYRLDKTHFIEYSKESFYEEIEQAGLKAVSLDIRWGEIWAVVK